MWDAFDAAETDSPARSRRLATLADRLTGRDLTERYVIGLRAWDACLRGEPVDVVLHHAGRVLRTPFSWAHEDRGFEVPVLVALVHLYADRPWRAEQLFEAGTAEFERQGWRGAHLSFAYSLRGYLRYGAAGSCRPRNSPGPDCASPSAWAAARPCTGTPSRSSSPPSSPGAGPRRRGSWPGSTSTAGRSPRPWSSPSPRPCTPNSSWPAATRRAPSPNWSR